MLNYQIRLRHQRSYKILRRVLVMILCGKRKFVEFEGLQGRYERELWKNEFGLSVAGVPVWVRIWRGSRWMAKIGTRKYSKCTRSGSDCVWIGWGKRCLSKWSKCTQSPNGRVRIGLEFDVWWSPSPNLLLFFLFFSFFFFPLLQHLLIDTLLITGMSSISFVTLKLVGCVHGHVSALDSIWLGSFRTKRSFILSNRYLKLYSIIFGPATLSKQVPSNHFR